MFGIILAGIASSIALFTGYKWAISRARIIFYKEQSDALQRECTDLQNKKIEAETRLEVANAQLLKVEANLDKALQHKENEEKSRFEAEKQIELVNNL